MKKGFFQETFKRNCPVKGIKKKLSKSKFCTSIWDELGPFKKIYEQKLIHDQLKMKQNKPIQINTQIKSEKDNERSDSPPLTEWIKIVQVLDSV